MLHTADRWPTHLPDTGDSPSVRGCDAAHEKSCSCDNRGSPRSEFDYVLLSSGRISGIFVHGQAAYSSFVCFFDFAVNRARLRYRSLLLTTNFKVALQVESTFFKQPPWTNCVV